jgi:predicted PurR-regulated permease PerM
VETMQRRGTFGWVVLILAATVVVLAGMRVAAPVLNPIFFAIVFSLLCSPIYAFLC